MMRRSRIIFLMLLLSVATSVTLKAQGLALKAGMNLTTWSGNDVEDAEYRSGLLMGFSYRVKASEKLFFVPGIQYTQRGMKSSMSMSEEYWDDIVIDHEFSQTVRTNYLDIPLALEYYLDESLFLSIQPTLSFLMKNNFETVFTSCYDGTCTGSNEEGDIEEIRDNDFTLGLGFGYSMTKRLAIITNYQIGLMRLDEEGDSDVFNRSIAFALEYRF